MSVLRTGRGRAGGGGGGVEYLTEKNCLLRNVPGVLKRRVFFPTKFFFQKCSWGSETHANKNLFFGGGGDFGVFGAPHAPTRGSRGVRKQYTSSYEHDMWPVKILERSGLAVKSYHPETLAAEEEKKIKKKIKNSDKNHKAFTAGSRECLIMLEIASNAKKTWNIEKNNLNS